MKYIIIVFIILSLCSTGGTQMNATDSVIVELGRSSRLLLTIGDRRDILILQHYDFQSLFEDILERLEEGGELDEEGEEDEMDVEDEEDDYDYEDLEDEMEDEGEVDDEYEDFYRRRRIIGSGSLDFGLGNYISSSGFPNESGEQYSVRPWGSWYVGLNSNYHILVKEDFRVDLGLGVSWYNFKFEDEETFLLKTDSSVLFVKDPRDFSFEKSKLTIAYINASIVPMWEFGHYRHKDHLWKSHRRNFRVGAGLFAGYRIDSYAKQVFNTGNEERKERDHDSFYLNNLRYGVRVQLGIFGTDFFFNYDLNELFAEGRGPQLNAYSFGIVF